MTVFGIILIVVLALALPIEAMRERRRVTRELAAGKEQARTDLYRRIVIVQWALVAAFTGWWFGLGRGPGDAWLALPSGDWSIVAVALAALAGLALIVQAIVVPKRPEALDKVRTQLTDVQFLVPRTQDEQRWFFRTSMTAGICEEWLYRGLLLSVLIAWTNVWAAVALSTLVFGLGHLYQGRDGFVRTAMVGLAMALATIFSGSVFVAMVLHILIDLTSGRIMGAALRTPVPATAAGTAPGGTVAR